MRVLVVTPWFPSPAHTGAGIFNLRDAQLLARDHDVTVLHLIRPDWWEEDHAHDSVDGIDVRRVAFAAASPRTWKRTRLALRSLLPEADAVHTMAFPALLPMSGVRIRLPWIHTEHWGALRQGATGGAAMATKALKSYLRRPDEVVAVSNELAGGIAGWCRRRPHVIGNAVPLPSPGQVSKEPAARGAGAAETLRIVSVGGVAPHKGPCIAVRTIHELKGRGIPATLTWVGVGPQRGEAEALAATLGIEDRVRFTGQLERAELESELLRAHLFVLPTAGETFGVAFAEALACGLPVVATGQGGHVPMLAPFEAARVVDREPAALADGVMAVLEGDGRERRQETAIQAAQAFSEDARRSRYADVYREAQRHARN